MKAPEAYIGRRVRKTFADGVFDGSVTATRHVRHAGRVWRL
jgi:hypothetical protein